MPNIPWNDKNEEQKRATDHDTVIELMTLLKRHMEQFDHYITTFQDHAKEDNRRFDALSRLIWMGAGGVAVLVVLIRFIPRVLGP